MNSIKSIRSNVSLNCSSQAEVTPIRFACEVIIELLPYAKEMRKADDADDFYALIEVVNGVNKTIKGHSYSKDALIELISSWFLSEYTIYELKELVKESVFCQFPSDLDGHMIFKSKSQHPPKLRNDFGDEKFLEDEVETAGPVRKESQAASMKKEPKPSLTDKEQAITLAIHKFLTTYKTLGERRVARGDKHFINLWNPNDTCFPRYAWQWNFSKDEYTEIKGLMAKHATILKDIAERNRVCCKLIQLYVSEWYKREFNGNDKKEKALSAISSNISAQQICNGIGIDEYSVYKSANNQKEWLETIYVDGGLPLFYLQIKESGLKTAIIEILEQGSTDLGKLCKNQVINQSYYAHDLGRNRASIYEFVEEVIKGDDFIIDGFEQFNDIVKEAKRKLQPKFHFICNLYQEGQVWYRSFNLVLRRSNGYETTNYLEYYRLEDWIQDPNFDVKKSPWCDICVYTRSSGEKPALFLKATNNFKGYYFIPDNNMETLVNLNGDDAIDSVKVLFCGMDVPVELKAGKSVKDPNGDYVIEEFSRVQLDEIQPNFWGPHKEKSGLRSCVFYSDSEDDPYEINESSIYHDTEIEIYGGLGMHMIDIIGILKFTDGMEFHSTTKFTIAPKEESCKSIFFSNGDKFRLTAHDGGSSDVTLLVVKKESPADSYTLFLYGTECTEFQVEGFDLSKTRPYVTTLFLSNDVTSYELGKAVIIPGDKPPFNKNTSHHEIVIHCTADGNDDKITLQNTVADTLPYQLQLEDGGSVQLQFCPPYRTFDIIRNNPKTLLNTFEYKDKTDTFSSTIEKEAKADNGLIYFSKPSREFSRYFYIRQRTLVRTINHGIRGFLKKDMVATGNIREIRFLVDPEFELCGSVKTTPLTCEKDGTGFFRLTEDAINLLMKGSNIKKPIRQSQGKHLQMFTDISIKGLNITLTQIK